MTQRAHLTRPILALLLLQGLAPGCPDPAGGPTCADGLVARGDRCVPRFDECPGPAEVPVLGGGCAAVGVTACATGFASDGEGGCTPVLPAGGCGPGLLPGLGQTTCQTVGPTGCAPGFAPDPESGCVPVLPAAPCAAGEREALGELACQAFDDCGAAPWGDVPLTGSDVFVDAASAAADPDGSAGAPFRTIQEALHAGGAQVVVAEGTYVESLEVARPVRLAGRCAARVTLVGTEVLGSPAPALTLGPGADGAGVTGLTLSGPGPALIVEGASDVTLSGLRILYPEGRGLLVDRAEVSAERLLVQGALDAGIYARAGTLVLTDSQVDDTRSTAESERGVGLLATCVEGEGCGALGLDGVVISRSAEAGVVLYGTSAELRGTLVRDGLGRTGDHLYGRGVSAQCHSTGPCPDLVIEASVLAGNRETGVFMSGGQLTLSSVVVAGTRPEADTDLSGRGIFVRCSSTGTCGEVTVRDSLIDGAYQSGIDLSGVPGTMVSSVVRRVRPLQSDGSRGYGVFAECDTAGRCAALTVENSLVEQGCSGGIVTSGYDLRVSGTVVRDIAATEADGSRGYGISAQCHAPAGVCGDLRVERTLVERTREAGIVAFGVPAELTATLVQDVDVSLLTGAAGRGVNAECHPEGRWCGPLVLAGVVVRRCHEMGVFVSGLPAEVRDSVVEDLLPDLGGLGRGIHVQCDPVAGTCGALRLTDSTIRRTLDLGVLVLTGAAAVQGALVDTVVPAETGDLAGDYGAGLLVSCEPGAEPCAGVTVTGSELRGLHSVGIALVGVSATIQGTRVRDVLPRPLDGLYGYGLQVSGLANAPVPVLDVSSCVLEDADLAAVFYDAARGRVEATRAAGAAFSVIWSEPQIAPVVTDDNDLDADLESDPSLQIGTRAVPSPPPI